MKLALSAFTGIGATILRKCNAKLCHQLALMGMNDTLLESSLSSQASGFAIELCGVSEMFHCETWCGMHADIERGGGRHIFVGRKH